MDEDLVHQYKDAKTPEEMVRISNEMTEEQWAQVMADAQTEKNPRFKIDTPEALIRYDKNGIPIKD